MKTAGIYKITNSSNNKMYIGSSKDVQGRFRGHRHQLKRKRHHSTYLQNAWNKYGEDVFVFEILEECQCTKEILLSKEQYYIDLLTPEYNMNPTAGSRLGSKVTDETKAKMSESMKGKNVGKVRTPEMNEAMTIRVKESHSRPEVKEKMRNAKLGTTISEETKKKMSDSHERKMPNACTIANLERKTNDRMAKIEEARNKATEQILVNNNIRTSLRTLSNDAVLEIRSSTLTNKELGVKFGCSDSNIGKIRKGLTYKNVW